MGRSVVLISGNDESGIVTTARRTVRELAGDHPDPFSLDIIRQREEGTAVEALNLLITSLLSPPFLGGKKTVWLQGFAAFDAEGTPSAKTAEAVAFRRLVEVLRTANLDGIDLVMTGPGIDERKALCQTCREQGRVILCRKPELRDRNWQADMASLIRARAAEKRVELPGDVCLYLVEALGTDTGRIEGELEKLICYCGGTGQGISLAAAQEICCSQGEAVSWALRDAVGARDLDAALGLIEVLLQREKDPEGAVLGLVSQVASQFRQMLQLRVFMQTRKLRSVADCTARAEALTESEREECVAQGIEVVRLHPFRLKVLARQALSYNGTELTAAVIAARDTYWRCVSSAVGKRVLLEELLMRLLAGGGKPAAGPGARMRRA